MVKAVFRFIWQYFKKLDKQLFIIVGICSLFSIVLIYSIVHNGLISYLTTSEYKKQLVAVFIGILMWQGFVLGNRVVFHGITNQRLQRKCRQQPIFVFLLYVDVEEYLVGIADAEQIAICLGKVHLVGEFYQFAVIAVLGYVAECVGELVNIFQGSLSRPDLRFG